MKSPRRNTKNITAFDIYCHGPILHLVQMRDGQDSKDFVDRPMKMEPHEIMNYFKTHFVCPEEATTLEIEIFLNVCFDAAVKRLLCYEDRFMCWL